MGAEFVATEGVGVTLMSVEGGQESGPLLHDAYASVRSAVNAALMSLGNAKGALEVEVVYRQLGIIATGEQARGKGEHRLSPMAYDRIGALRVQGPERFEQVST